MNAAASAASRGFAEAKAASVAPDLSDHIDAIVNQAKAELRAQIGAPR
jgi:hypothetical protein